MATDPPGKHMERVKNEDLYKLLEVDPEADTKTIKKAYRKIALTCHPDKNPDDKTAVEKFHKLSDALEVLTDDATRKAYDNLLKARKAAELRMQKLDGKRRKLKEQLEEREKEHVEELVSRLNEEEMLAKEIERLRKQGSKQLEEEQEFVRSQLEKDLQGGNASSGLPAGGDTQAARIKVKWDKNSCLQYSEDSLRTILLKYGNVTAMVVKVKKCSAIVEFEEMTAAKMAVNIETGFPENKLKIKPLWEEYSSTPCQAGQQTGETNAGGRGLNVDFESLVMRKLRQEEERKRLIAQMMAEDS